MREAESPRRRDADEAWMSDRDSRREQRNRVLKGGKVVFDNAVFDCHVLDISPNGARVRFSVPVVVPEAVVLRLRDGASYHAVRRWSRGNEVGLEFSGPAIASNDEALGRAAGQALETLRGVELAKCYDLLLAERFFGNENLRKAADAARIALFNLETILRQHAAKPARPAGGAG